MYTRLLAQQRFDTFAEIDFDDALYRRLENEHGFHDTFCNNPNCRYPKT